MKFVCPRPMPWYETYQRLYRAWEGRGGQGEPPKPLILAGWWASSDRQKQMRWEATVAWAEQRGLGHLLPELREAEKHLVVTMSDHTVGPLGGPMCLPWDYTEKDLPDDESLGQALATLRARWREVAGEELAAHTEPLRFTGRKRRRLVVGADPDYRPPWGSWCIFIKQ